MEFSATFSMPTFLSTANTSISPKIDISSQGSHQLVLRRMSVNVVLGATKGIDDAFDLRKRLAFRRDDGSGGTHELSFESDRSAPKEQGAARLYHLKEVSSQPFSTQYSAETSSFNRWKLATGRNCSTWNKNANSYSRLRDSVGVRLFAVSSSLSARMKRAASWPP